VSAVFAVVAGGGGKIEGRAFLIFQTDREKTALVLLACKKSDESLAKSFSIR